MDPSPVPPGLAPHLSTHAGLLQQVLLDLCSLDGASLVEVNVDVLPEAAGVVVPNGLGVAEGCMSETQGEARTTS